MFSSRSSTSVTLLVVFLILIQSLRLNATFLSANNERVFKIKVSLYTKGYSNIALNEKMMLEESFQNAYMELIALPVCSFRFIEDIDLVGIKIDTADEAFFFLDFEMTMGCLDCFNKELQLFNDDENDDNYESWNLEEVDTTCYWSSYFNDMMEDEVAERNVTNIAPSMKNFVKKFNEKLVMSQEKFNSIENVGFIDFVDIVFESEEPILCPCNPRSYCTYANFRRKGFWRIPKTKSIYYNCTCADGFSGEDGWRCDPINECEDPDNWPCAPPKEGGFCVDYDPDDNEYQSYKCGCRAGFVANETYLPDERHGIKHCIKINDDVEEEEDPSNNKDNVTFTITCDNQELFPSVILVNVTGNIEGILDDKDKLERSIKIAYEGAVTSRCNFRTLENVTLLGFLGESDEFVQLQSLTPRRYLEEEGSQEENNAVTNIIPSSNGVIADDDNGLLQIPQENDAVTNLIPSSNDVVADDDNGFLEIPQENNSTLESSNSNNDLIVEDDNRFLQINFNFSLIFSIIMRCFGCPDDANLFKDAFRRRELSLRGNRRILQEEDDCFCEIDDGSNETSEVANIAPSLDDFVEEFNNAIVEQGVDSIEEATGVEDKTDDSPTEEEEDNNRCNGKLCNELTQFCNGKKCQCKAGFFSYSGVGGRCFDIQECTIGQHMCHKNADCIEQFGSYTCSCKIGYSGNPFESCADINECELGKNDCNATAIEICINTPGSFTCALPTSIPTHEPTRKPTRKPTISMTTAPSNEPIISNEPSTSDLPSSDLPSQQTNLPSNSPTTTSERERDILEIFYVATNGASWRNSNNKWLETSTDHCNWYGIKCTDGEVTDLDLYFTLLDGILPKELGLLTGLEYLKLAQNELFGSIPNELAQLTNLKDLYLYDNEFSGLIPSELAQLTNLEGLYLYKNEFTGYLPSELGLLTGLKGLSLSGNDLSGSIPNELAQLTNLKDLYLYDNEFIIGLIPSELGLLTGLKYLYLSQNELSGPIPTELGQLTNLKTLNLSNNTYLYGTIPSALCKNSGIYIPVDCSEIECACCSCR